jgi:FtsP/CotA-like multicopper oxidase with cupredoxin domain
MPRLLALLGLSATAAYAQCCDYPVDNCGDSKVAEGCVCTFDPYCCTTQWDKQCFNEAVDVCGMDCSGPADTCSFVYDAAAQWDQAMNDLWNCEGTHDACSGENSLAAKEVFDLLAATVKVDNLFIGNGGVGISGDTVYNGILTHTQVSDWLGDLLTTFKDRGSNPPVVNLPKPNSCNPDALNDFTSSLQVIGDDGNVYTSLTYVGIENRFDPNNPTAGSTRPTATFLSSLSRGNIENCLQVFPSGSSSGVSGCATCAPGFYPSGNNCLPCDACNGDKTGSYYVCPIDAGWGAASLRNSAGELDCANRIKYGPDTRAGLDYNAPSSVSGGTKIWRDAFCTSNEATTWVYNITVRQDDSIGIIDDFARTVIWIGDDENGFNIPGPQLATCFNDTIVVNLVNDIEVLGLDNNGQLSGEGTSIHWHGMFQLNNQFMDGVAQVTQCPINGLGGYFQYKYRTYPQGSFWYHSHTGEQYGDGMFGPLTVFERRSLNTYENEYDRDVIPMLMIGDWWHKLSQDLQSDLFFGLDANDPRAETTCAENGVTCIPRWSRFWPGDGAFNCICGGSTSDYRWTSGYMNGIGQNPDLLFNDPAQRYHQVKILPNGQRYRFRFVNSGFNYGMRMSIDQHTFRVIAADSTYLSNDAQARAQYSGVDSIVAFPGERYDFIVVAKTEQQLAGAGGRQFYIRGNTFNDSFWFFNESVRGYEFGFAQSNHEVKGILNYANRDGSFSEQSSSWWGNNSPLAQAEVAGLPPRVRKIVDTSQYMDWTNPIFFGYSIPAQNWITALRGDYTFEMDMWPGYPNPIPDPDVHIIFWVNGLMYPNYQLFIAKSPVRAYDPRDPFPADFDNTIDRPIIWARPTRPLVLTKGKDHLRNLNVIAPPEDSPGHDPTKNPPRGPASWGGRLMEYPPFSYGVANVTNMVSIPYQKWIRVYLQDGGPMVHPFHIHGYVTYMLGQKRKWSGSLREPQHPITAPCTRNDGGARLPMMLQADNPITCNRSGVQYTNGWGTETVPPVHSRSQPFFTSNDISFLNTRDPPRRDITLAIPHGWTVFQFYTDNPGAWFMHCHLEFHVGTGMAWAWLVGVDEVQNWLYSSTGVQELVSSQQDNCQDTEFEGPLQFW